MKRTVSYVALAIGAIVVVAGCSPRNLPRAYAQNAIDAWIKNEQVSSVGSIQVIGIRDQSKSDVTTADLQFVDFRYRHRDAVFGRLSIKTFTGSGLGRFVRYTDGRWMLKRIEWGEGLGATWVDEINVAATGDDPTRSKEVTGASTATNDHQDLASGSDPAVSPRALELILSARDMVVSQETFDVIRFAELLDEAQKSDAKARPLAAAEMRRLVIRTWVSSGGRIAPSDKGFVESWSTLAIQADPHLQGDDTLRLIRAAN